mmetsp:Transcript_22402/g.29303  ORF Transcript_22402/g.29303 Transcript_22402/m.29303 type:complete len:325 (-) Transcript_22402:132-1106(-)
MTFGQDQEQISILSGNRKHELPLGKYIYDTVDDLRDCIQASLNLHLPPEGLELASHISDEAPTVLLPLSVLMVAPEFVLFNFPGSVWFPLFGFIPTAWKSRNEDIYRDFSTSDPEQIGQGVTYEDDIDENLSYDSSCHTSEGHGRPLTASPSDFRAGGIPRQRPDCTEGHGRPLTACSTGRLGSLGVSQRPGRTEGHGRPMTACSTDRLGGLGAPQRPGRTEGHGRPLTACSTDRLGGLGAPQRPGRTEGHGRPLTACSADRLGGFGVPQRPSHTEGHGRPLTACSTDKRGGLRAPRRPSLTEIDGRPLTACSTDRMSHRPNTT